MKEIKFRVWSEVLKRFYKQEYIGEEVWCNEDGIYWPDTSLQIWQQYTGLKDKNGVEIYEGDIIKQLSHKKTIFDQNYEIKFKLMEDSHGYYVSGFYADVFNIRRDCEVIGNIFQNSDLLK